MRNLKRVLSLVLTLALVLSCVALDKAFLGASADSYDQALVNSFTDIKGHWASEGLTNLIGYGYMRGVGDNKAAPNETLTTAQLVALLVRIMGGATEADLSGYADMDRGAWYYSEMAQGVTMGIIPNTNTNYMNPRQEASREYAAYMLCRAFGLTVREPITDYSDADKVSDWAVSSMQAMVAAKAIIGSEGRGGRYLYPQETITRGEFAQMIHRLCEDYVQTSDSSSLSRQTFNGGLLIAKSGVTLDDCTIKGNLYIADSVGSGTITLKNTKVEGNIYARGGGDHSVHLEDASEANSVVLINPYMATRLVVSDDSKINGVLINNGVDKATLEGPVGNVTINVSDVDLVLDSAKATNVIVNSANSIVTVDKDSTVETLSIASSSEGTKVDSDGVVNRLALMANSAELDLSGTLDYLLIGAVKGLDLDIDSSIKLGALDLHCSDSTIKVDSEVKSINVSAFSEKLKLELGKNTKVLSLGISSPSAELTWDASASIGAVTIDAPKYKGTINSALTNLTLGAGATEAEITLGDKADITNFFVNGDKIKIDTKSGAKVADINVTGKEVEITGSGAVARVNAATTAEGMKVSTGNTAVANAGADKVTVAGLDLPAGKTYVTTSDGKDVIRNNDGTPDGDGNKNTSASEEVATVANFELTFASAAQADDLHSSKTWTVTSLIDNGVMTKNTSTGAAYVLSGNVKKTDNFTPVHDPIAGYGTGYYVPVVVSADFMEKENDWVVSVGGVNYTKNNLSQGTGLKGKLIVYLQLSQATSNRVATVTLDRDGTGTKYSPVTVGVDYSKVSFDGVQDYSTDLVSYPVRADKTDLTTAGVLTLADFGSLSVAKTSDNTFTLSGTANKINSTVVGNVVSGGIAGLTHYAPVLFNTSNFSQGWSIVFDDGTKLTAANVSQGTSYKGQLIALLGLSSTKNFYTFYVDSNGDGYSDGSYVINVGMVKLADVITPVQTTRLSMPTQATTLDMVGTGLDAASQLGSFGLTPNYMSDSSAICLTGSATELNRAPYINVNDNTGKHYYPLLVDTSDFTGAWSVTTSKGGSFNRNNTIPAGGNYAGKLMIFVKLEDTAATTPMCTINVDKNGDGVVDETWKVYTQIKVGTTTVTPSTNRFALPTASGALNLYGSFNTVPNFGGAADAICLTGNAKTQADVAHANAIGNVSAKHFVPVLIDTSDFTGNWTVRSAAGTTFTSANLQGDAGEFALQYKGKLILLVGVNAPSQSAVLETLTIDKDGNGTTDETWKVYSNVVREGLDDGTTPPTNNVIKMELATKGNAIDFAGTGFSSISDFGTFTIQDQYNSYADAYMIKGTANYIEELAGGNMQHDHQHHYVPVVIDTTQFTGDWKVDCVTGEVFTKADVVKAGGAYEGKLVILIDLYHFDGEVTDDYTSLMLITRDNAANPNEMLRIYDQVSLSPAPVEDYGQMPEGVSVELLPQAQTVSVFDKKDALKNNQGQIVAEEALRVVKVAMLENGYRKINSTAVQGVYTIQGTKDNKVDTFEFSPADDVYSAYNVSVYYPGSNSPMNFTHVGETTVQEVLDEYMELSKAAQATKGNYYFKGLAADIGKNPLEIANAQSDKLTGETSLFIGYYKVTTPLTAPLTADGMTATAQFLVTTDYDVTPETDKPTTCYVLYNQDVQVTLTLTGETTKAGGTVSLTGVGLSDWTVVTDLASDLKGVVANNTMGVVTLTTTYDTEANEGAGAGYTLDNVKYVVSHKVTGDTSYNLVATPVAGE